MIPPKNTLPTDVEQWKDVQVSLPRLPEDSQTSCPDPLSEIMDYVRRESADGTKAKRASLRFLRTAQIEGSQFWMWTYTESDGEICYVYYHDRVGRGATLGLQSTRGLTPEQFMLAVHYGKL